MTSENPDMLYPISIEDKELEMQTLKRGNIKRTNEEVLTW